MNVKTSKIKNTISEIKRYNKCNSFSISPESCSIIIEALKIQVPEHPKCTHSYEYADRDGNRGIWMDFVDCPNCGYDLCDEENPERCPECEQLLDWNFPEEEEGLMIGIAKLEHMGG